jgi:hypothetical protein
MNPWDSWTTENWVSYYSPAQHSTGTLFGKWTVAELKDLLAEKNRLVAETESALSTVQSQWLARNPAEANDWLRDWQAFKTRYAAAVANAGSIPWAQFSLAPESYLIADDAYKAVLRALSPVPNTVTKGSLQDLINRLSNAGGRVNHDAIQPRRGTDADLNWYKRADTMARTLDPFGLLNPNAPKGEVKNKWATIGLVAAGVAALFLVLDQKK